jgi:putative intracellular protease/amidase
MRIVMPLPSRDYDPSEAAVSWWVLRLAGHEVRFATPDGRRAQADPIMLSGRGLDWWSRVPGMGALKLVGLLLRANRAAREAHAAMAADAAFLMPLRYADLVSQTFDGLILPGGHASGVREYLESAVLHGVVAGYFDADKPVGAICHGVVVAARSVSRRTGRSVLHGRRTTALTWQLERSAWHLARRTRYWDPNYYRTYVEAPGEPAGYRSVQAEVTRALARPEDFLDVPANATHYWRKTSGLVRDLPLDSRPAFVVRDGRYVSARWPGDVYTFARLFAESLKSGT